METQTIATTKWALDPTHSEVVFKVKHLMISSVKGEFRKFNAAFTLGEDNTFETGKLTATIDAASVFTNNDDRDNHLRSGDFFDVENYNELTFESYTISKIDEENYKIKGQLTIKGITKEVVLNAEFGGFAKDPWGNEKAGFSFEAKFNRKDWGLNWNAALETGGVLVGEEIKLNAEIQFIKA